MIVLSLIMKNSFERLKGIPISLEDVLNSSLQVPYSKVILIDDSDTDRTRKAVSEWCSRNDKELVIERSGSENSTRATARQTAIDVFLENFTEDWLFFLDDDVILNDGWWDWIINNNALSDPEIGEV